MTRTRRYLTTPIYYASGDPHIGHAYTTILADVLTRFWRQDGADVFFLTGTDEHGQKISEEARRRGITPRELCDLRWPIGFRSSMDGRSVSPHDRFIRTTETEHKSPSSPRSSQRLWDRATIYQGIRTPGWYCIY